LLALRFLGEFSAQFDGKPLTFRSAKIRALLAYLAIEANRPHSRESLATLLWSEHPDTISLTNLRVSLNRLRDSLTPHLIVDPDFLSTNRDTITLHLDSRAHFLDTREFDAHLDACQAHAHKKLEDCPECIARFELALTLYSGDFLPNLMMEESPVFEEWRTHQVESRRQRWLAALSTLTTHHLAHARYDIAQNYADRQLVLQPWRESAHRQKMLALYLSGQPDAALAQYHTCQSVLKTELAAEPGDEINLLFKQIQRGDRALFDAPKVRVQIPAPTTRLFGRERELAQIAERLARSDGRLVSLIGIGGIGKTASAIHAGYAQAENYRDGIFFIDLSSVQSAKEIAPVIAASLGIRLSSEKPSPEQLIHALRGKEMLLVLDNGEHLVNEEPRTGLTGLIASLLSETQQISILITSRLPLNLKGEWRIAIDPLSYSASAESTISDPSPAVQLFVERATRANATFSLNATNSSAVVRICQLAEGIPLAIEIAAERTRLYTCTEVADQLEKDFDLVAASVDIPARQRSLRATFEYSWKLLSKNQRAILPRLAALENGFERGAAEFIADADPSDLEMCLATSLLRWDAAAGFRIHESVRHFLLEKLNRHPMDARATWEKCLEYYLRAGDRAIESSNYIDARRYYDTARAVLVHLEDDDHHRLVSIDLLIKRFPVLFDEFTPVSDNFDQLERAEGMLRIRLDRESNLENSSRLAQVWLTQGRLKMSQGNLFHALEYFQKILDVNFKSNRVDLAAMALGSIGQLKLSQGRIAESLRYSAGAVNALEEIGAWREWHWACLIYALALAHAGECQQAKICAEKSQQRAEADNYFVGMAQASAAQFLVSVLSRDYLHAQDQIEEAVRRNEECRNWMNLRWLYCHYAAMLSQTQKPHAALAAWEEGEQISRNYLGNSNYVRDWYVAIKAQIALEQKDFAAAKKLSQDAERAAHSNGSLWSLGIAQRVWAGALAELEPLNWKEIDAHLALSLQALVEGEMHLEIAQTRMMWGKNSSLRGEKALAQMHFKKAADQFQRSGIESAESLAQKLSAELG